MKQERDGNAIVYCEGAFNTTYGKTAHGLVRFTRRYDILSVIDSGLAGRDAAEVLDGTPKGIPVMRGLDEAIEDGKRREKPATHFVIGLAPDGGVLDDRTRGVVLDAVSCGLNVDSGLHHVLSEDPEIADLARARGVTLRDVRKTPGRKELHGFSGKISEVDSMVVALLGTDSAVGKRTTAWILKDALEAAGFSAELVGTGQTAWLQGVRYGIILDSLINDFVAGEIEHAVWTAYTERRPDVIIIEGQGSLMNPAYPGGFEILAAARPHAAVMQHAPARKEYDGFPGFPLHPIGKQIEAVRFLYDVPTIGVTINHENISPEQTSAVCEELERELGIPVCDPLRGGVGPIVRVLDDRIRTMARGGR